MASVITNQLVKSAKNVFTDVLPSLYSTNVQGKSNNVVPFKTPYLLGVDPLSYKKSEEEALKKQYNKLYAGENFFKDLRNRWPEVAKTVGKLHVPILQNPREPPAFPKQKLDEPWRRPYPKHYAPW